MKEQIIRIEYVPITVPDRPAEGAKITAELRKRGINLLAIHGFPITGGKAQIDLVPEDMTSFTKTAKEMNWTMGPKKTAFLIQGEDRVGAVADIHERLAGAGISVIAATGVTAGNGRFGCILWVSPADVEKTARTLEVGVGVR